MRPQGDSEGPNESEWLRKVQMSKATRQMLARPGREGVALDEAERGPTSDEACGSLLANVLLDEVDKALEQRGLSFVRYANDCNVYVGSTQAVEREMAYLRKLYTGLKLQINEAKSAVASAFGRTFLGYALWGAKGIEVRCKVADKSLQNFKARIRQFTRRSIGRSLTQVVEKLRPYRLGWKAYSVSKWCEAAGSADARQGEATTTRMI